MEGKAIKRNAISVLTSFSANESFGRMTFYRSFKEAKCSKELKKVGSLNLIKRKQVERAI
jgi:hypothetical protein